MPCENIASEEQRRVLRYLYDHDLDGTRDRSTGRFKAMWRSPLKRELKISSNSPFQELARNGYIRQVRRGPSGILYFRRRGVIYVLNLFRNNAVIRQALVANGLSDNAILNADKYQIRNLFPILIGAMGISRAEIFDMAQPTIKLDQEVTKLLDFISKSGAGIDVSSVKEILDLATMAEQRNAFNSVVERLFSAGLIPPVDYLDIESAPYVCWITTEGKNAVTHLIQQVKSSRRKRLNNRKQHVQL